MMIYEGIALMWTGIAVMFVGSFPLWRLVLILIYWDEIKETIAKLKGADHE